MRRNRDDENDPYRQAVIDGLGDDTEDPFLNPPSDRSAPGPTDPMPGTKTSDPATGTVVGPGGPVGTIDYGTAAGSTVTTPATSGAAWNPGTMQGSWDLGKWNDPSHQTVKYLAGRWMAGQDPTYTNNAALAEYLRGLGYGATANEDVLSLSGKELASPVNVDTLTSGGQWWWGPEEAAAAAATTPAAGAVPTTPAAAPAPASQIGSSTNAGPLDSLINALTQRLLTPIAPVQTQAPVEPQKIEAPTPSPFDEAVRSKLLALLDTNPNDASIDSPALRGASEAYRRSQERTMDARRTAIAEQLAAQGLGSSGAMDTAIERGYRDFGNATAEYDANLVLQEQARQVQQLQQALSVGAGLLTADQERALRTKLAELQAQLSRDSLAQQAQLSRENLSQAGLLGLTNLLTNNQQFYDRLGVDMGNLEAYWNNQLIASML